MVTSFNPINKNRIVFVLIIILNENIDKMSKFNVNLMLCTIKLTGMKLLK